MAIGLNGILEVAAFVTGVAEEIQLPGARN